MPVSVLAKLVSVEAKLLLREPGALAFGILFPSALLLGLGAVPLLREPSPEFGGLRFVDYWAPSALILGLGIMGLQHIPTTVAAYREKGVLRRMSTTPVGPGAVLVAQLIVAFASGVVTAAVLIASAWAVLDVSPPEQPWWFALSFAVGYGSLLAVGMLIAAVVPSVRLATGAATLAYMVTMVIGGVFLPRFFFPDALARLGDYTPPGVQAMLDSWSGEAVPDPLQLGTMALIGGVAAAVAARFFRWE
ncbi:ABC transporter permease [Streptomonospora sp. PA3]|nr:ABC transporter permease [Streptomonospora sp. PA3]